MPQTNMAREKAPGLAVEEAADMAYPPMHTQPTTLSLQSSTESPTFRLYKRRFLGASGLVRPDLGDFDMG